MTDVSTQEWLNGLKRVATETKRRLDTTGSVHRGSDLSREYELAFDPETVLMLIEMAEESL